MDDNDIEFMSSDIFQELPEHGAAGDSFHMGGFAFLPVDSDRLPAPVLAGIIE
jgi:hypothetical protein